jgi:hypothetical protein
MAGMPDNDPQRRHPRLPVSIDCQVEGASGHASLRVSELSLGGCYVDTRRQFGAGAPVTIRAAFPTGEAIFTGRVIYELAGHGFGVAFDELSDSTREHLENFLNARHGP